MKGFRAKRPSELFEKEFYLQDDAAQIIKIPERLNNGFILLTALNDSGAINYFKMSCQAIYNLQSTLSYGIQLIWVDAATIIVSSGVDNLYGATGTDGKISLALSQGGGFGNPVGVLGIENRSGAPVRFRLVIL